MKLFFGITLALTLALGAWATTVQPPSFEELVDRSTLIFSGHVTDVQSVVSGEGERKHLATRVTFTIGRTLKGECPATLTLEFMGGERGPQRFEILGQPKFEVGEHGIYFVENRAGRLCPLTRLRHGRYRVVQKAPNDTERVARDDHSPLREISGVREPLAETRAVPMMVGEGLTLAEFERAILQRVSGAASPQPSAR